MKTPTEAAADLLVALNEAEGALARDDSQAAEAAMAAGAAICRQMQADGQTIPAADLVALQKLATSCGVSLTRIGTALNAESLRDDNHRRALVTYQDTLRR